MVITVSPFRERILIANDSTNCKTFVFTIRHIYTFGLSYSSELYFEEATLIPIFSQETRR